MRAVISRSVFLQVSAAEVVSHFRENFQAIFGAVRAFPMCTGAVLSFLQRLTFVTYAPFASHTQSEKPLLLGRRSSLASIARSCPPASKQIFPGAAPPTNSWPLQLYPLSALHGITCPLFGRCLSANRCPPRARPNNNLDARPTEFI